MARDCLGLSFDDVSGATTDLQVVSSVDAVAKGASPMLCLCSFSAVPTQAFATVSDARCVVPIGVVVLLD